ncbi:MAG: hypothetical protein IT288_02080 [Bdellovibrionales bacterium]|nr:hypothetical protein [Bdellovibrionales bacterium]
MPIFTLILVLVGLVTPTVTLAASETEELRTRLDALENKHQQTVQSLTDELAQLKLQMAVPELTSSSYSGMGVAASKVYYSKSALSIGGYGEVVYTDTKSGTDSTDAYRLVPYIGYRFAEDLIFNAEIEFEHGGANAGGAGKGEAIIEFAYLDFLLSNQFKIRAGHVLIPVGLINLLHEPTNFPTVQRPEVEKNIIPSTWHENGVLAYGDWGPVHYYLGAVNSGDAAKFSKSSWIRGTRQKGAEAKAEDFSYVLRLDSNSLNDLTVGGSLFSGKTSQGNDSLGEAEVRLGEVHATFKAHNWEFMALYAAGELSDTDKIRTTLSSAPVMGAKVSGYYAWLGYDLMRVLKPASLSKLPIFVSHESYNLHEEVESGQTIDPALEKVITTVGLNYKPVTNVVVKANYQFRSNENETEADRFELGLGWIF